MKNSELYQLAFQCLISDEILGFKNNFKDKIIRNEEALLKFIRLSSNHLVLPAIYHRLQNAELSKDLPTDLVEHLLEITELNRTRNIQILHQIEEINEALLSSNIQPIYLKGTAHLMENLYSEISDRMIGDIDLLVQDNEYLKTAEIIKDLGYNTDSSFYDDVMTLKDYPRLFKDDVPADVEIHRVPVEIPFSKKFSTEVVVKNKKTIANKTNCFVPSDEHKVINTFIHSQLSNQGYRFKQIGLRDLYDFYLLSKKVNLNDFIETIEEKEKVMVFANYAKYLMSPSRNEDLLKNKKTKTFIKIHHWFMDHPKQHYYYINTLKLYNLIYKRYVGRIFRALFQKSSFLYIYNRLKNPKWYRNHIEGIMTLIKN